MSWARSLIKLATYEVETLQKRMAEIVARRQAAELKLIMLDAEGEAEIQHARRDAEAGWYQIGFLEGLRRRKALAQEALDAILQEEAGARDALAQAFESQKKYEHVAETAERLARKDLARREGAELDEMGLRRATGGR